MASDVLHFPARRRLSRRGTVIHLKGGGWFRVLPSYDNLPYQDKIERLRRELREEKGFKIDDKLFDKLTLVEIYGRVNFPAMCGEVIKEFGGFDDEDGNEIPPFLPDGSFNEEGCVQILMFPGVGHDFADAIKLINEGASKDKETAEKNSSELSDGSSATEGS